MDNKYKHIGMHVYMHNVYTYNIIVCSIYMYMFHYHGILIHAHTYSHDTLHTYSQSKKL